MREFAFGTEEQFNGLDQMLQDHQCHVYNGCVLPTMCEPNKARVGFEKTVDDYYILYIDKGINACTDNTDFNSFIDKGEIRFICFDDMISFLHSIQPLFERNEELMAPQNKSIPPKIVDLKNEHTAIDNNLKSEAATTLIFDPAKVKALKAQSDLQKMVWPEEISEPLKRKVFGQDEVLDEIAKQVVINRVSKEKKLLVMALIGPTATGKSETAKSLASVLSEVCATPYGCIELRGSEFLEESSVARLFGAAPGYVGYGKETALQPVRLNKRQVIVIDEIEKANLKLLDGLMEAIDTGFLGMADNSEPIDLRECILLFTSNIPIDMEKYRALSRFERGEMCRDAFTAHCKRPEISGKIGNFVVFNPLSVEAQMDILVKFIKEELDNFGLKLVNIDEHLMIDFLNYQTKYGARAIRGLVRQTVGEQLLGKRKLDILKGKEVRLTGKFDNICFDMV